MPTNKFTTKSKACKFDKSKVEEKQLKLLRNISKLGAAEEKKTKCDIFGELIAAELKTLN